VNNPDEKRATRIVDWILTKDSNTLVLSEMRPSKGGRRILASLQAEGYQTTCSAGWEQSRYFAVVATRGTPASTVQPAGFDPRVVAVDVTISGTTVRIVGIYAPTNGMSQDSSNQRRTFQARLLDYLRTIGHEALCVAGDLNVIEPNHRPRLPAFEPHDYAFYTGLVDLGLRDAYRAINPNGTDHSWVNARHGNQRLDHVFVHLAACPVLACAYDHSPRSEGLSDHSALVATVGLRSP
jgi:exonuclease III